LLPGLLCFKTKLVISVHL